MWAGAKDVTKKQAKVSLEAQTWIRCEKPLDDKSSEEGISLSGNRKAWWESPLLPARALGPGGERQDELASQEEPGARECRSGEEAGSKPHCDELKACCTEPGPRWATTSRRAGVQHSYTAFPAGAVQGERVASRSRAGIATLDAPRASAARGRGA